MFVYDLVVVGGGIVGLATARAFARNHPRASVLVIEKEDSLAAHQTGHNSGVIHAGIYYRPGSLKATICRAGVEKLKRFCDEHAVRYRLIGKLIVATSEDERPRLDALLERGRDNGVAGLRRLSREEMIEREPHVRGVAGILSPGTGVVSFRQVAEAVGEELRKRGAEVRTGAELVSVVHADGCLRLTTTDGEFVAKGAVTCAGLQADRVARLFGDRPEVVIVPFRGEYYRLNAQRRDLVRTLIYPVPDPRFPFLGVHFTTRIDGEVEAGPNAVLSFAREGYRRTDVAWGDIWDMARFAGFRRMARRYWRTALDEQYRSWSKRAFVRSLQRLVPDVTAADLEPGGAGVRAMALERDGRLVDDFRIVRTEAAVHVLSAPSPAATSAFAIADHVVTLLC